MGNFRIGSGHDTHRLVEGRPLILGGIHIPYEKGLYGHSDADVVMHAITDALLGAIGAGDIGDLFPDTDPANKDRASIDFLTEAQSRLINNGWAIENIDLTIFAEKPKLGDQKQIIREHLARVLCLRNDQISIKAKTGEKVGHIGRGEAIGCHAVALVSRVSGS